ncbi:MAG: caspase family protein [Xanthobacteraceae bacterium]|nr:caspase family protein [Xanthobacteraceae bacterium]
MFRRTVLSVVAAATLSWSAGAALAESRMALVIGQSAYRAVTPLPNPANDAKAMAGLLGDAGFEVTSASDLSQNALRQAISDFAGKVATRGPDTVALVFYAGHGMQIDGENFLVPVDIDPRREADIPLQAVRLNDILNTLTSVPSRMRLVLLDACRNNPFPDIGQTAGRGLAIVDARFGAPGTFLSFSTSPGAEAEDGSGANSPYTTALLSAAREPGLAIEDAFKRVRVAVNKATEGRQTPWESSSLTDDFRFFATAGDASAKPDETKPADAKPANAKPAVAKPAEAKSADGRPAGQKRSTEQWKTALQGKPAAAAHEMIVADGSVEAYEAFVALYTDPVFVPRARAWLERQLRMIAWNKAVIENSAAGYRAFLLAYPDSDLTATARKLEQRLRNRPNFSPAVVAALPPAANCSCGAPPARKADHKKGGKPAKKQAAAPPPRRAVSDDPVPERGTPVYVPTPGLSIGIGGGFLGGGGRGGYHPPPGRSPGVPTTTGGARRGY